MARTSETKKQADDTGARAEAVKAGPDTAVSTAAAGATPSAGEAGEAGQGVAVEAPSRPSRRVQVKVGKVVSNKMQKTVIVTVENTATHRLYHRYMKRTSKFAAHDAENRCQVGDLVEIVSSRPLSHSKRWRVREVLKRAQ
jgi:small subunit ribosomal protein S17